jgi:hypothetical protein
MSLKLKSKSPAAPGDDASSEPAFHAEADCCTNDEHHRCLILTLADGTTEGFPLTWLYHWEWITQGTHERLVITLTEHKATIRGKNLSRTIEALSKGTGLHLRVKDERYQSVLRTNALLITHITVQPHTKYPAPSPHENQS